MSAIVAKQCSSDPTTLVVSHDSGGAEVLSSYVRRRGKSGYRFSLSGPAVEIFVRKIGAFNNEELQVAIETCGAVLCGSGWGSDHEWSALRIARRRGKSSTVFLDHWINYRERFTRGGEEVLPDFLWVGDSYAEELARRIFPGVPVNRVENPYLADQSEYFSRVAGVPNGSGGVVLFVGEPIEEFNKRERGNGRFWGYTETDALNYLLSNLTLLLPTYSRVLIRPHPAEREPESKYRSALRHFGVPFYFSRDTTLLDDICGSELVAGCESTALVVALLAARRVVSCVPPGGKRCSLPHREIEHLQAITADA